MYDTIPYVLHNLYPPCSLQSMVLHGITVSKLFFSIVSFYGGNNSSVFSYGYYQSIGIIKSIKMGSNEQSCEGSLG